MRTRGEILKTPAAGKPGVEKRFRIRRPGLFGSYARNLQSDGSDMDTLVNAGSSIEVPGAGFEPARGRTPKGF